MYERELVRAQAAEVLAEERRWEVVRTRNALHGLRTVFERNREKLAGARAELLAVRRAAKTTLRLQAEVARLGGLLKAVSVDPRKRGTMAGLRMENGRLRGELEEKIVHVKKLEAEVAKLRSTRATLSKTVFGRNSEKTGRPAPGGVAASRPAGLGMAGHNGWTLRRTPKFTTLRQRTAIASIVESPIWRTVPYAVIGD